MMAAESRRDRPGAWAFGWKRDISSTGTEGEKEETDARACGVALVG